MQIERMDTFSGHRGPIYSLEQGMDSSMFYSAGSDGWVVQWNLEKPDVGKVIAQMEGSVYAMRLDSAEGILWVGQNYEGIHGVNVAQQERVFSIPMPKQAIYSVYFWGSQVWVGHDAGLITVLDRETKQVLRHIKAGQKSARTICLLDTGKIAVGYSDGWIRVFDAEFQLLESWQAHQNSVFSMIYRESDQLIISVGRDAHIKSYSLQDKREINSIPGHIYAINDVVFSPDGLHIATGSMDKTIKIWESETMQLKKVIDYARYGSHQNSVNRLIWTPFEDLLVSCSDDKNISVWKIHERNLLI